MKKVEAEVVCIIVSYNSGMKLDLCISALLKAQLFNLLNLIIVIVDNNSEINEIEPVQVKYCLNNKIVFLRMNENLGYSRGNNCGLKYVDLNFITKSILILNPDVIVPQTFDFRNYITLAAQGENVLIVQPKIIDPYNKIQGPYKIRGIWYHIFSHLFPIFRIFRLELKKKQSSGPCERFVGCCFFINPLHVHAKFFDENIFLYFEEDIIAKKCKNENLYIIYDDTSHVIHDHKYRKCPPKTLQAAYLESGTYYFTHYLGSSKILVNIWRILYKSEMQLRSFF